MFNSIVLDTVIGMVFIFLLYSLLVTILGEMIANWLGLRSRMLRQAIERMLNDGYDVLSAKDPALPPGATQQEKLLRQVRRLGNLIVSAGQSIGNFSLYEFKDFKTSMAGRFYNQPSIKFLTKEQRKGVWLGKKKPSYIRPDNFSETLIQLLKGKGSGETDKEKILYCLRYNTLHIQPETLEQISTLFKESGGDLEKFKIKLNSWYDEMMERLTGWFKRKIQLILFLLGLMTAFTFNVDSIAIAKKLSKDKNAREQMVQMAIAASDSGSAIQKALQRSNDSTIHDSLLRESYRQVKEATEDAGQILGLGWDLTHLVKPYRNEIPNTRLATCWNYAGMKPRIVLSARSTRRDSSLSNRISSLLRESQSAEAKYKFLASVNYFNCSYFSKIDKIEYLDKDHSEIRGVRNYNSLEKIWFIIKQPFKHPIMLLGFIITALAISLGSNFWFDLLKKLVSIRGSGVNPDETKKQKPAEETVPHAENPMPPLMPFALMEKTELEVVAEDDLGTIVARAADEFSAIPGILGIEKGFIKETNVRKEAIEISITDPEVKKKLTSISKNKYHGFPVNFIVTGPAVAHAVACGDTIANENAVNGIGTTGCFVKKTGSAKFFLLTCWHVLKGDRNWNMITGTHMTVVDKDGKKIARVIDGSLTDRIDAGFAEMLSNEKFDNKKAGISYTWREVTVSDALDETPVKFLGASSGLKEASIYKHVASKKLDYPDGGSYLLQDLFSITVYDDNGKPCSPSSKGDSGALVVDHKGYPLGLVIGGDEAFSYVAKLSNILSENSIYKEYTIIV